RAAMRADARSGEARLKLAEAYLSVGDVRAAIAQYIRAADLLPLNAEAQLKAGQFLLLTNRYEEARVRALAVVKIDPRNASAHILLGNAIARLGNFDKALEEMEKAVEAEP